MKKIKMIFNYLILPPIKLIILIISLLPFLWLVLAGDEEKAIHILNIIIDYKME